jgi:spore germination cell wall hydrolase CwlJ-like protein
VVKLLGGRLASAIMGLCMLGLVSSEASAQGLPINVKAAVASLDADQAVRPLGRVAAPAAAMVSKAVATTTTAVSNAYGTITQAQPAQSVTAKLPAAIATEAAWLYKGGWPLAALVQKYSAGAPLDEQTNCLATAVYFEARGEALEGQLAVARVIMNRAASGKYPSSWCGTMTQPWQFSFVNPRTGQYPQVAAASASRARAQGVARLAAANVIPSVGSDVLWYHATYVAPSWGRRLSRDQQIGAHIFYRS